MCLRRGARSTWQNELLEWGQVGVESVKTLLESAYVLLVDRHMSGDAQLSSQIKQLMLYLRQQFFDILGDALRK